jgi:hypothetical protein
VQGLRDIFNNASADNLGRHYLLNSVLFYCLLCVSSNSGDGESLSSELGYLVKKQSLQGTVELTEILGVLVDFAAKVLQEQRQQQALDVIRAVLYNGWTKIAKAVLEQDSSGQPARLELRTGPHPEGALEELLPLSRQREIVDFCQRNSLSATADHDWLVHKNRQSFQAILQYQHRFQPGASRHTDGPSGSGPGSGTSASSASNPIQLDLHYLLGMQNLGYDVLRHFKLSQNNVHKAALGTKEQMALGVSDIKALINSSYQFYTAQEDMHELLRSPNPFYECFLDQIIASDNDLEKQRFLELLQENRFKQAYEKLTKACFNLRQHEQDREGEGSGSQPKQTRILIDTQVKKFVQYSIHCKYFLLTLTMALNLRSSGDPVLVSQIERSRLICLATLPLMFDNEEFREQVEEKIANMPDLSQLIQFDNKDFFRLIKMMIKDEETFHLQNHFEKYFAISGFVRNLLNEVIKLQA